MIVGDDGSEAAARAVGLSAEVACLSGADIVLVRAYRKPPTPTGGWSPKDRLKLVEARKRQEKELDRRAQSVEKRSGSRPKTRLVEGDATLALIVIAGQGKERNTLLAVGGRGSNSTGRARLSGVPANVLKVAGCPTLICPPPQHR